MKDGDKDKLIKENNKAMIGEVGALQHTCEGSPAFILPPLIRRMLKAKDSGPTAADNNGRRGKTRESR